MARYYEEQTVLNAVCRGCNEEFSDEPCEPSDCLLLREIKNLSTADVVPTSEVAREIFEEIENLSVNTVDDWGNSVQIISEIDYAELKKKYTEGGK
ncbi:MAG: hypothetical protein E7667_03005 [Ruminococcaceae bacterium]|nr:hypothetical protein [Oscillospiraceae bacterium]